MVKEDFKADLDPSRLYRTSNYGNSAEFDEELIKNLELLSAKLKGLEENHAPEPNANRSVDSESTQTIDCSFADTCYTAKHKMGSCPCELQNK